MPLEVLDAFKRAAPGQQREWIQRDFPALLKTLVALGDDGNGAWNLIGNACINNNLYAEAEALYDELIRQLQKQHKNLALPAYYRGIAHFLQGRFQDAYADFKLSRQSDLQTKNLHSPATQALAYMEDTLFPTRETIKQNQQKLVRDLNIPRALGRLIGPNVLRTIHKWNSASPLFSSGISQGGGYFLTLKNARGEIRGIAIDPGYDFFDIFRDLGLGIADIDAIIITHDHDDHTESVEGILSLLAKFNDHNEQHKSKVIDIFGSAGVLLKFHGLLSATDLFGNREINYKLLIPGAEITEVEGVSLLDKYGFTISAKPAHHTERWTNQESSVGLVIHTNIPFRNGEKVNIGITGDTRYEAGLGKAYRDCQFILLNIGSVEKEEGKFLKQHLGMLGCINLLKEARLGKPVLAILTEFGEEFSGRRETISRIIENWAQPMEGSKGRELRVIPADVHLEIKLDDQSIRETETNIFFPYNMIKVDESDPEILKYKFNG
ncbi:MAG: MBL fold metallo-hydrolase [Candidatus Margulisbacteria bacterium]|jgi:ribonuclease BN (tRNA processing enzyme)|nr:MBL fold metallo-hydrolase [Candidatus Margulisiibacteriota bacterium]